MVVTSVLSSLVLIAAAEAGPPPEARAGILARVAEMRAANYAVDEAAMRRLAEEFRRLAERQDNPDRWLAHYEAGMASAFLAAFVGPTSVSHPQGDPAAMLRHMEESALSLEAAVELEPDFADAHAALANNYGMRAAMERDPARLAALVSRGKAARARSLGLAPRNPRVVVGHAGALFWAPPEAGGDRRRGIERYREALALFPEVPAAENALHCWGEPDTWAFLAMAYLMQQPSNPAAAKAAIDRALLLRPDFAWARRSLLPRIEAALQ